MITLSIIINILLILLTKNKISKFIKTREKKGSQPLLDIGPEHSQKIGTPTMGGLIFWTIYLIFATLISIAVVWLGFISKIDFFQIILFLAIIFGYFWIGYKDDTQKINHNKNEAGLTPKQKLLIQFFLSFVFIIALILSQFDITLNTYTFLGTINIGIIYYFVIALMIVGMSNATNLTDGLDGLLATNSIVTLIFLSIFAINQNQWIILESNLLLISVLIGFLYYNKYPAKIFMGDTGSLALGAYIAIVGIALKIEFLLIFIGIIYILEAFSVIIQVTYYKWTKKRTSVGKRIFLMAPIHHHFEKKGYTENKIIIISLIINFMVGMASLIIYF